MGSATTVAGRVRSVALQREADGGRAVDHRGGRAGSTVERGYCGRQWHVSSFGTDGHRGSPTFQIVRSWKRFRMRFRR